ncbi:hypothetical protein A2U01_0074191, partial [Trifolium medium]|nr:hypothetical protein [Trifolium medium]
EDSDDDAVVIPDDDPIAFRNYLEYMLLHHPFEELDSSEDSKSSEDSEEDADNG